MSTLTRRTILTATGAIGVAALLPSAASAQEADAQTLLTECAAAMAELKSFQFELTTVNGTSTILDNLELKKVAGKVLRPDSFSAEVTAGLAVIDLTVEVIGIGTSLWVTDPLDQGGRYIPLTIDGGEGGGGSLAALINPDRLFLAAVGLVENPVVDGTEKLDGVETTVITGEFDAGRLTSLGTPTTDGGEGSGALPAELILERMPVTIWIDEARRVVRLEIEGQLTSSESPDVIRGIDFYDFDAPVEIVEPENVTAG